MEAIRSNELTWTKERNFTPGTIANIVDMWNEAIVRAMEATRDQAWRKFLARQLL